MSSIVLRRSLGATVGDPAHRAAQDLARPCLGQRGYDDHGPQGRDRPDLVADGSDDLSLELARSRSRRLP